MTDPRLQRALELAAPHDPAAASEGCRRAVVRWEAGQRRLRAAATYPLVLAFGVAMAGAAVGVGALPALDLMGGVAGLGLGVLAVEVVLVGLGAWLLAGRPASRAHALVSGLVFVEAFEALAGQGAEAPGALRGAASFCATTEQGQAGGVASALEAGRRPKTAPSMLSDFELGLVLAAARTGTLAATSSALAEQRRVRVARELPAAIARIQLASLVVAGVGLAVVGITFFTAYGHALAS